MKIESIGKPFTVAGLLIAFGLLGTVLFFPINIDSKYSCLSHRIFNRQSSEPLDTTRQSCSSQIGEKVEEMLTVSADRVEVFSRSLRSDITAGLQLTPTHEKKSEADLLGDYVFPYAFLWWASLLSVVLGGIILRKGIRRRRNPPPDEYL